MERVPVRQACGTGRCLAASGAYAILVRFVSTPLRRAPCIRKDENVANIKSQKKRIRTNEKARLRNKAVKSALKTAIKKADAAVASGDRDAALAAARDAARALDKAASKGVIHPNQAANRKSGLMARVNAMGA